MERLRAHLSQHWLDVGIAAVVCVVYTGVLIWALITGAGKGISPEILLATGDAHDYYTLAQMMLSEHRFVLTPDGPPEFFRIPGYPVFVAIILAIFHSVIVVALAQIALIATTSILIYRLGVRFFSRVVGVAAALIFAFDPTVMLHSLTVLSESLFVFLLVVCVYILIMPERGAPSLRHALMIGLLIGAVTLTRPVGQFLLPLMLAYYLWRHRKSGVACLWGSGALMLGLLLVAGPWLVRNGHLGGSYAFTSAPTYNMLFYNVVEYQHEVQGVPKDAFRDELFARLGTSDTRVLRSFSYKAQEAAIIDEYIGGHIPSYAFFHIVKTIPLFIGSSIADTGRELVNMSLLQKESEPAVSLSGLVIAGDVGAVIGILAAHPFTTGERILWLLVCSGAVLQVLVALWRRDQRLPEVLLFCAIVGVLAILVGVIAYTRYRIPAEPFLLLLGLGGLEVVLHFVRKMWGAHVRK